MASRSRALRDVFSPVRSTRKSDEVFDQIARFIRNGRFKLGTKLPPERELVSMFNTSRQTIREALYRAELVGLIEVRHGTGSYVTASRPREAIDRSIIDLIEKEAHRVSEFFEIRRALEGWCAAHAAKVAGRGDLKAMKDCLARMKGLDVTTDAWEENDIAFHHALAAATGNPLAIRMMDILRDGFSAFYRLKRFIPNREEQHQIWQHHADIYEAVRRKSPVDARAAIVGHMDFIEVKLNESMDDLQLARGKDKA